MSRGILLSFLIHIIVFAGVFVVFKENKLLATKNKGKVISLSFVKIEKKPRAKSLEHRAVKKEKTVRKKKLRAKSIEHRAVKKEKTVRKKEPRAESLEHRAVKKLKAKSRKLKAQSRNIEAKKIKKRRIFRKKITKNLKSKTSTLNSKSSYLSLNRSKIYEAIQRAKRYPLMAKRLRKEGVVHTCFTLLPNGNIKNITTSGAHRLLMKGAYQTILDASVEFPNPNSKVRVCLNISYKLDY